MALTGSAITTLDIQPAAQRIKGFSIRAALCRTLAIAFVAILFAPLVGAWRHWDPAGESTENRELAHFPEFSLNFRDIAIASDQFLDFYRDHFGFRNTLIRAAAITRLHTLHEDVDGRALIGKDGWLFYRPDGDPNLVAFRGINPFSRDQLDAWQQLLERRNAILAARRIPFLVVIVPDKQTMYSEFLPDAAAILVHRSRLDEVIDRLHRTYSAVHLLDLRPALLAAKGSAPIYYKTDTHWNDLGAYAAYRAIVDAADNLLPGRRIVPRPPGDFIEESNIFTRGDLSRMIHRSGQYPDTSFILIPRVPFAVPPIALKPGETAETEVNDPTLPRLVFFHDSFGDSLIPMLGPHFRRALWANREEMDPALIDQEKPDIVIDEFVERDFYRGPPTDPPAQESMPRRGLPGS